jgi:hypothetical protein
MLTLPETALNAPGQPASLSNTDETKTVEL